VTRERKRTDGDEALAFEAALEELERLVRDLEGGGQSLDQALETFERGVKLVRLCSDRLHSAQVRLLELEQTAAGLHEAPLDLEEEG
jgi:exodeoxyribonuclease VII small subunit